MADVYANSMACHVRAKCNIAGCCHPPNSMTSHPAATCHNARCCHLANSMLCHPRATCHIAGCCHLANSVTCYPTATCHIAVLIPSEFTVVSSQSHVSHCKRCHLANSMTCHPKVTWHIAGCTWRIKCHVPRAMCHIAGCCHLANSITCHPRATCHNAGCCHLANLMTWPQSHVLHCWVKEFHLPCWKFFFAVFYFFVFLMQFGLWRAAAFVSYPMHLLYNK